MGSNQRQKKRNHQFPLSLRFIRKIMSILMHISNSLTIKFAYWLWFRSPKFPTPARELSWAKTARHECMPHKFGPITYYSWGSGPCVVLVHGWSGRGLQLAAFAAPLVAAGFRVVAFDGPGHGNSPGSRTTIFELQQVLSDLAEKEGPVFGIVAHSFGVLVSALAIKRKLAVSKLVCISSPSSARYLLQSFCSTFNLSKNVEAGILSRFNVEFGEKLWDDISAIENLRNEKQPVLIIHDKEDSYVPCSNSRQLHAAIDTSEMMITTNLGHHRILREPIILEKVTEFMQK